MIQKVIQRDSIDQNQNVFQTLFIQWDLKSDCNIDSIDIQTICTCFNNNSKVIQMIQKDSKGFKNWFQGIQMAKTYFKHDSKGIKKWLKVKDGLVYGKVVRLGQVRN